MSSLKLPWRSHPAFWMVLTAFLLRIALMLYTHSYEMETVQTSPGQLGTQDHFGIGYETGAIAASLANGHGFSSPFGGDTGPSAWVGPVYAGILALIFKIFGTYSIASSIVMLAVNSLFSALTCLPMWGIGMRTVGRNATLIGCWIWTAGVSFMEWPLTWIWDMPLSALIVATMFLLTLQLVEDESAWRWNVWGLWCGLAALTNPALITCIVISGLWLVWRRWQQKRDWLKKTVLAACLCIVMISPWLVRNRMVFGQWVFLRSNFGFELGLGNYQYSSGFGWRGKHPMVNKRIFEQYKSVGEIAFLEEKKEEAYTYVEGHPGEFLRLSTERAWSFWAGTFLKYAYMDGNERMKTYWPWSLAMVIGLLGYWAKDRKLAVYFTAITLLYPLPYYFTYPQTRYRHAIEPLLLLLCGYMLAEVSQSIRQRSKSFPARTRGLKNVTAP